MGYLTALARTDLSGDLNYTDHNIVEKLFQTYTMQIERFHETWNGSQTSAGVVCATFEHIATEIGIDGMRRRSLQTRDVQRLRQSLKSWLTAYTAYYNHHRSHQALDNQPSVEALKQEDSI